MAVCDHCLGVIADGEGVLEVDTDAADRAMSAWRKRVGASVSAVFQMTPGIRPVPWAVRHSACAAAPKFRYEIAVERVRSWTGLLDWTVHLADKHWLAATDWYDLLSRALHPRRAAVSGILPRTPRDLRGGPVG